MWNIDAEFRRRQEEEEEYQRQLDMLGGVWSFGSGFAGQLGHGDLESNGTPRLIKRLRGRSIAQVYAVSVNDTPFCLGSIADSWRFVLQGFDSDVAFAVSRTGDVYVWGKRSGPTGLSPDSSVAALVKRTYRDNGLFDSSDEEEEEDVLPENSPAGANRQRRNDPDDEDDDDEGGEDEEEGGEEDIIHPVKLSALCGEGINFIAVGRAHCCAKTKDGDVFTWGRNEHCQLGDEPQHALSQAQSKKARSRYGRDRLEPLLWERTIPQLDKVVAAVAVGTNHTFAVTSEGETLAFGATFRSGESSALARSLAKLPVTQVTKVFMEFVRLVVDPFELT